MLSFSAIWGALSVPSRYRLSAAMAVASACLESPLGRPPADKPRLGALAEEVTSEFR